MITPNDTTRRTARASVAPGMFSTRHQRDVCRPSSLDPALLPLTNAPRPATALSRQHWEQPASNSRKRQATALQRPDLALTLSAGLERWHRRARAAPGHQHRRPRGPMGVEVRSTRRRAAHPLGTAATIASLLPCPVPHRRLTVAPRPSAPTTSPPPTPPSPHGATSMRLAQQRRPLPRPLP